MYKVYLENDIITLLNVNYILCITKSSVMHLDRTCTKTIDDLIKNSDKLLKLKKKVKDHHQSEGVEKTQPINLNLFIITSSSGAETKTNALRTF